MSFSFNLRSLMAQKIFELGRRSLLLALEFYDLWKHRKAWTKAFFMLTCHFNIMLVHDVLNIKKHKKLSCPLFYIVQLMVATWCPKTSTQVVALRAAQASSPTSPSRSPQGTCLRCLEPLENQRLKYVEMLFDDV